MKLLAGWCWGIPAGKEKKKKQVQKPGKDELGNRKKPFLLKISTVSRRYEAFIGTFKVMYPRINDNTTEHAST